MREGFCVAIVLTTPPFPYDRKTVEEAVGLPIFFDGALTAQDQASLYYGEVGLADGQLVTSGKYGWTMVATGVAGDIAQAQRKASGLADRVIAPNVRYRRDIGNQLMTCDYARVERLDLFDASDT